MDYPNSNPQNPGSPDSPPNPDGGAGDVQQFQHRQVGARVPEAVARGVFSTGAIVITGQGEFVLDFVQRLSRPHQVVARVVLPHNVIPLLLNALRDNFAKYVSRFGEPPALPRPDNTRRPAIREVYEDLKINDDVISGSYANAVMISHSAAEFSLDFVTQFFPHAAVSQRVFLSAPQLPRLIESLANSWQQVQNRPPQEPPAGPA